MRILSLSLIAALALSACGRGEPYVPFGQVTTTESETTVRSFRPLEWPDRFALPAPGGTSRAAQ